ncbi:MAG TPA: prephenate dehydrogenase/arogenate dehydrogenase family protein, partial [Candidatus Limnocylindrales bacterium]
MRLSILGFGLIGGSIARALHERSEPGQWHVTAWSRSRAPVEQAVTDGAVAVAAATVDEAVRDAEIVVLAAPPSICLDLIDMLAGPLRNSMSEDCAVTDVASAKGRIVARADAARLPFIGGHPMAGRELSGYAAALPDLFVERPWVTVLDRYARL